MNDFKGLPTSGSGRAKDCSTASESRYQGQSDEAELLRHSRVGSQRLVQEKERKRKETFLCWTILGLAAERKGENPRVRGTEVRI